MNSCRIRESLVTRYFAIFLLVSLVPLLLSSFFIIQQQFNSSRKQILAQLDSVATIKQSRVKEWVKGMQDELVAIHEINPEIDKLTMNLIKAKKEKDKKTSQVALQNKMSQILHSFKKFEDFFVLSREGIVIGASNPHTIGEFRGKQNYFVLNLVGAKSFFQINSFSSKAEEGNTVITVLPIINKLEMPVGLFCARANLKYLDFIMFAHSGLGISGETILVGENHVLLGGSRYANFTSGLTYIKSNLADKAIRDHTETSEIYFDYRNQKVLGVSRWIPELRIALISKQDIIEVYQDAKKSILISVLIVFSATVSAIGFSIFFSRKIVTPINSLSRIAKRITEGELELRINFRRNDELGSLGKSFNQMADSLSQKVADLKKNMASLNVAREEAEKATVLKGRFLDIAAHELKTPVTAFSLLLQLTQRQLEKGIPVTSAILARLIGQSNRISKLVVDLLDVSRLERGTVVLNLECRDLNPIINECIQDLNLREPKRVVNFLKAEKVIEVNIDPLRISQLLTNILDNANKYTPIETPIEITEEIKDGIVRVSITDHGCGISEKQKSEIFKPFERGSDKVASRAGGVGLGLYISSEIMKLHRGCIGVKSKIDNGSTFYFEIPLSSKNE